MSNSIDPVILFCAFRYALGRRTYVVSAVCQQIHRCWETLCDTERELFVKEILEYQNRFGNLGHECDAREWLSIVDRYNSAV